MKNPLIPLAAMVSAATAAPDGAQLFTTNCSACHLLDQMVVGPSLAEIRTIYDGKPDEFVKWAVAPEQKRDGVIEMPSMVHVGDEGLRAIYAHVMKVSEGVTARKQKSGDPYAGSPPHVVRPQVQRIFMPDAGPAAIAIALDEKVSLCWDAGESRLRYAWTGGFIDGFPYWSKNGSSQAKVIGKIRYTEKKSPFSATGDPDFLGYSMIAGLPVLKYRLGSGTVTESFSPLPGSGGFSRTFTMNPAPTKALALEFPTDQEVEYSSEKGEWNNGRLTLQPADSSEFTIKFSLK